MIYLIASICGAIAGGCLVYLIIRPKLNQIIKLNENIQEENHKEELKQEELRLLRQDLQIELDDTRRRLELAELDLDKKKITLSGLMNEISLAETTISSLKSQADESAELFYQQSMSLAEEKLDRALEAKALEIQQSQEDYLKEYNQVLEDCVEQFQQKASFTRQEIDELTSKLTDLRARVEAAVEANRRAEEILAAADFYKLNIPVEDQEEIAKLRSIIPDLRNPEPLNKVIWKVYYEKPYTDLIGRVVGPGVKTGIYKITNIENNKCYVGQAVNYWPMKNFSQLSLGV